MSVEDLKTSDYEYGLTKIMGAAIKEIHGYVSGELGEPTFKMTCVELEDGTTIECEGEHDLPYLAYNDRLDDTVAEIVEEEDAQKEAESEEEEEE